MNLLMNMNLYLQNHQNHTPPLLFFSDARLKQNLIVMENKKMVEQKEEKVVVVTKVVVNKVVAMKWMVMMTMG